MRGMLFSSRGISWRSVLAQCCAASTLAAVVCLVTASFADESLPTVRMRAGSKEAFKDSQGNQWLGDASTKEGGFEGGSTVDRAGDMAIENTKDPDLYRHERYSMTGFNYKLPNGKYVVKLHFAETFDNHTGPDQRVFSFNVQDEEIKDFDVFQKAGGAKKAYVESVPAEVTEGKLAITFTPKTNYPEINGIEIIPADKAGAAVASGALPTVRMRAGAKEAYKDSQGNEWLGDAPTKDGGFEGGNAVDRAADLAIENTKDPDLYRHERWGMTAFNYKLPNGKYVVKMHFAETFDRNTGPEQRVFSFKVQDKEFKDFDLFKKAGWAKKAYVETVPVEATDGKLTITFTPKVNYPQINGIEIIPADKAGAAAAMDGKSAGGAAEKSALPTIRVRAGVAKPYKDSQGNVWMADEATKDGGFEGGEMAERDADMPIANTNDADLYRFEHWGMEGFNYKLPNGKYVVKLHFAETWQGIDGPGGRMFAMKVQDKEFPEFDVWKKAGDHQRAYIESVPVEIKDGKLTITFTAQADNPEINAIEILPAK